MTSPSTLSEAVQAVASGKLTANAALDALPDPCPGALDRLDALFTLWEVEMSGDAPPPNPLLAEDAGDWLTVEVAARLAGVNTSTVRRWAADGKVESRREGRGKTARYLISRDSLWRLLP